MGRSMHYIQKVYYQKGIDTKSDGHIALLQIRSTPLGPELPSPKTLIYSSNKRHYANNQ